MLVTPVPECLVEAGDAIVEALLVRRDREAGIAEAASDADQGDAIVCHPRVHGARQVEPSAPQQLAAGPEVGERDGVPFFRAGFHVQENFRPLFGPQGSVEARLDRAAVASTCRSLSSLREASTSRSPEPSAYRALMTS